MVFRPGRWFFPWCFPIWGPDVKVAKIHSSSKRKKEPKASFSMGFRSYVRHFRGAILGLLRPSEAWCFAPGRWFFPWCFPIWGPDVKVAKIHSSSKRKKEPKASFSMGLPNVTSETHRKWCFWLLFPLAAAMNFSYLYIRSPNGKTPWKNHLPGRNTMPLKDGEAPKLHPENA